VNSILCGDCAGRRRGDAAAARGRGKFVRIPGLLLAACIALHAPAASAQAAPPGGHEDTAFDFMNLLAHRDLHDIKSESWNGYGQFTYISSWKLPFQAPYTNANGSTNSLLPTAERSYTGSFTLFFGLRLWTGAEAYLVPELIAERPLSQLRGFHPELRASEVRLGDSEPIPLAYLPPPEHRPGRDARREDVGPDAARDRRP